MVRATPRGRLLDTPLATSIITVIGDPPTMLVAVRQPPRMITLETRPGAPVAQAVVRIELPGRIDVEVRTPR
jgi:uncharacterized protein YlxW (UPF0749 family)